MTVFCGKKPQMPAVPGQKPNVSDFNSEAESIIFLSLTVFRSIETKKQIQRL